MGRTNIECFKNEEIKTNFHIINFLTLKEGETIVRFCPPTGEKTSPYIKVFQHYLNGYHYCIAPKEPCPICETYAELELGGEIELAREIKRKEQFLFNVVVLSDNGKDVSDSLIVQVFKCSPSLFEIIRKYYCDPDYGDLDDPLVGYDFLIIKEKKDGYYSFEKSHPLEQRALAPTDELRKKVLDLRYNLEEIPIYSSSTELKEIVDEYINEKNT